jgi:hypothetical protein
MFNFESRDIVDEAEKLTLERKRTNGLLPRVEPRSLESRHIAKMQQRPHH